MNDLTQALSDLQQAAQMALDSADDPYRAQQWLGDLDESMRQIAKLFSRLNNSQVRQ